MEGYSNKSFLYGNEYRTSFIVGSSLLPFIFFVLLGCSSHEKKPGPGTGSEDQGMLQKERNDQEELEGRVQTLRERFQALQPPPSSLGDSSRKAWMKRVDRADSILSDLEKELDGSKEKAPRRTDRLLQRLAAQHRSMQKVQKKGSEAGHP